MLLNLTSLEWGQKHILYINSLRPWRSSGFSPTGPGANRRAEFPVPSLWAKLLEEIRLRHSSAERRPGIANVKNGVPGRVRSGLCVTEVGNFCSREHPLREVISSHFSESFWNTHWGKLSAVTVRKVFGMVVADFGYCSCARLQNVSQCVDVSVCLLLISYFFRFLAPFFLVPSFFFFFTVFLSFSTQLLFLWCHYLSGVIPLAPVLPVECFGGLGKGEPGEARGGAWGGQGLGEGELDGCIMHRVHTSIDLKKKLYVGLYIKRGWRLEHSSISVLHIKRMILY